MTPPALHSLPHPDADTLTDHWWWRPGWQLGTRFYAWHITVDLRLATIADYQTARPFGFLDLIPRQWLHVTVQGVDHTHAVSHPQRDAIIEAVTERLADVPAPTLTFARPVLFGEAVVIQPTDPQPLRDVRAAIRAGIEAAYGPAEGKPTTRFRPHVSAAYVNASADPRPVREALDAITPDPAQVTITHASLIEMHRDNRMYEWTTIAAVPLGREQASRPPREPN
jgi:hypothetical protein